MKNFFLLFAKWSNVSKAAIVAVCYCNLPTSDYIIMSSVRACQHSSLITPVFRLRAAAGPQTSADQGGTQQEKEQGALGRGAAGDAISVRTGTRCYNIAI